MGDIIMATSMISPLQQRFPSASITWICEPEYVELLRHHPGITEILVWPKNVWKWQLRHFRWVSLLKAIRQLIQKLRYHNYDMALDAQGLLRSRLICYLSGADKRIGFDSREPGAGLMTRIIKKEPCNPLMGSEYGQMINSLKARQTALSPEIVVDPAARNNIQDLFLNWGIGRRYAVIIPFTTRPQKHWPEKNWPALVRHIQTDLQLPVVMLGGSKNKAAAERIAKSSSNVSSFLYNLTGKATLSQTVAVIEQATLAVGVDTGLTHMAVGFNRPTVGLFGSTRPYRLTQNRHALVLYEPMVCSPCHRRPTCHGSYDCMIRHSVSKVLQAINHVLT